MVTSAPSGRAVTRSSTSARPAGQPWALNLSLEPGSHSSTSVMSSINAGQAPTEWCSLLPGAGQESSTSRIREAPTTNSG